MPLVRAGSKASQISSRQGVTENTGEEGSLFYFQRWHHLGAEAQQKADVALGALRSWDRGAVFPGAEGTTQLPDCGYARWSGAHSQDSESRAAETRGIPEVSVQMRFFRT